MYRIYKATPPEQQATSTTTMDKKKEKRSFDQQEEHEVAQRIVARSVKKEFAEEMGDEVRPAPKVIQKKRTKEKGSKSTTFKQHHHQHGDIEQQTDGPYVTSTSAATGRGPGMVRMEYDISSEPAYIGAHYIPGVGAPRAPLPFRQESEDENEQEPVIATTVPKLITAQAALVKPDEEPAACLCLGVECCSLKLHDDPIKRRRFYIFAAVLVVAVVAIAVGISLAVSAGGPGDSPGETDSPGSAVPSLAPSSSAFPSFAPTPQETETIFTTLESTHQFFGHMFDITAKQDLSVVGLEIHTSATTTIPIGK